MVFGVFVWTVVVLETEMLHGDQCIIDFVLTTPRKSKYALVTLSTIKFICYRIWITAAHNKTDKIVLHFLVLAVLTVLHLQQYQTKLKIYYQKLRSS